MRSAKSSISKATSYQEIGEYWDNHDLGEVWRKTKEAHFDVRIKSEVSYCALGEAISDYTCPK